MKREQPVERLDIAPAFRGIWHVGGWSADRDLTHPHSRHGTLRPCSLLREERTAD